MNKLIAIPAILSLLLMPGILKGQTESGAGTVAETITVANYIYIQLEETGGWLAASPFDVDKGDYVNYAGGAEMRDFYSRALDQTFDSVLFVQSINVESRDIEQFHSSTAENPHSDLPEFARPKVVSAPVEGEILPLEDGVTITDIVSDPLASEGKAVRLRARVTKVNEQIAGKNWVTLQDGSGPDPETKLIATSDELVTTGDTVIASGTIRNNVDIGSGYRYEVLLQKVSFQVE